MNIIPFFANEFIRRPAFVIFALIFLLTALNAFFNSLAFALGHGFPYTTFLFTPNDRFADFFKVIFSYPGAKDIKIPISSSLSELLSHYLNNNPYRGVDGLAGGALTHFHLTPLTTLFSLTTLQLMKLLSPLTIFIVMLSLIFAAICKIIKRISYSKIDFALLCLSFAICYPTLQIVTRGNLFSALTSVCIVAYLLLMHQGKNKYLALILLAIAVNIRPNSLIFLFALVLYGPKNLVRDSLIFSGITAFIFANSLYFSNLIYKDFTFENFLAGLQTYHKLYVVANNGLPYGSSLLGSFKMLLGYSKWFEVAAMAIAAAVVIVATVYWNLKRISNILFVFLLCASYVLGSPVFGDYHLAVFFAPLLCLYLERDRVSEGGRTTAWEVECSLILILSILLLSPKNYYFVDGVSAQVFFNPIVLLLAAIALIVNSVILPQRRGLRL